MKTGYIFLADGFEPLEAIAPMDILRRGKMDVQYVSISDDYIVESTQGYQIIADLNWEEFLEDITDKGLDFMVFPGGLPGADNLGQCEELGKILKIHYDNGGLVCAICAAPARALARVLGDSLAGRRMTAYEGFEPELQAVGATATGEGVTVDGNLITAKGPGLAMDFGFAILTALADAQTTAAVRKGMMLE